MAISETLFAHPGAAYRGKPFWSWNGDLKQEELIRQIHVLQEMGMGGYFCHSRTGLATEYLGDEWFTLINACADEGERLGMETWLYDEDRWPSGTAGGMVTADPDHRSRYLRLTVIEAAEYHPSDATDTVAIFAGEVKGTEAARVVPLKAGDRPERGQVLLFTVEEMARSSFYNGETYLDTMNPQAVQDFIEKTHSRYATRCASRLGRSIRGIFTDEPHRGAVMDGFGIDNPNSEWLAPFTPGLFEQFAQRFGYRLEERLPELFLQVDGKKISPVKWQYMEWMQTLFIDSFLRPIQDWCGKHGLSFTGHLLHEDSLTAQAVMNGSLIRCYEFMDVPGIDVLGEQVDLPHVPKQVQSAARQLGKPVVLSELYGCTGWQMTFQNHKEVGDWQALFGVNLRCHHLSWYTMQGEAKRDYPASILHQSAWYKQYAYVEDYYARIHVFLEQGEPVCDLLVINPVESAWSMIHVGWAKNLQPMDTELQQLDQAYTRLFHLLCGIQVDFDYGDEDMLDRLGRVEAAPGGAVLYLGRARYRQVLISGMRTIRSTTLRLLETFQAAGGRVLIAGPAPDHVDARPAEALLLPQAQRIPTEPEALRRELAGSASFTVTDPEGKPLPQVWAQARRDAADLSVMLLNSDRRQGCRAVLQLREPLYPERWDPRTGKVEALSLKPVTQLDMVFAPGEERLLRLCQSASCKPLVHHPGKRRPLEVSDAFAYSLDEPNVCVLDLASLTLDGQPGPQQTDILKIDRFVREHYGLPYRSGEMVQPWFDKKQASGPPPVLGEVLLTFSFDIDTLPGSLLLAIETPDRFETAINGFPVTAESDGWWVDACYHLLPLPMDRLKKGENHITLRCGFTQDCNLEALYLLGDFGVRLEGVKRTLIPLPERLTLGDICGQGLPFYGAGIRYRMNLPSHVNGRLFLRTDGFDAACVEILGNGKKQMLAFAPYETEISDLCPDAESPGELELHCVLTRRNTFGPLHVYPERQWVYFPGSFLTEGEAYLHNRYSLLPQGLTKPLILWREEEENWDEDPNRDNG